MNILCTSDLHGNLIPKTQIPKCDLILIAGDLCPTYNHEVNFQINWLNTTFNDWCASLDTKVIVCGGNHDFSYEKCPDKITNKDYTYLHEKSCSYNGYNIFGINWQRRFFDWAFNLHESELAKKWQLIPPDTDIIMCHGPAFGYGDLVRKYQFGPEFENVGSPSMLKRIEEIRPKLFVCGHIHSGYGIKLHGETVMVNASYVNERYVPTNEPILITL